MKRYLLEISVPILVISLVCSFGLAASPVCAQEKAPAATIKLPAPKLDGALSVEKALAERRSVRTYKADALSMAEVSQVLWAAQGITEPGKGLRTAASARGMYLLEVYLVAGNVTGLPAGVYCYQPKGHELIKMIEGDRKAELARAGQPSINSAPAALVITGASDRAAGNPPWMYMEAGHAAQNVYLQAVALGLGTVSMAGFKPDEVKRCLNLPEKEQPLYIMPVGKK